MISHFCYIWFLPILKKSLQLPSHKVKDLAQKCEAFFLAITNHLDATLFFEKRAKIYDFYYFFKKLSIR